MSDSKKLTSKEAGERLGFSDDVVRRLCESGKLEGAYRNGASGHWRVPESTVTRFLEVNRPKVHRRVSA